MTSSVKARMTEVVLQQPDDSTCDEILRELAFERMIERGLADSRDESVVSNEDPRIGAL